MGEVTAIEWTDHTFNPWWGCEKVSPACTHCYAQEFADRFPKTRGLWGADAPRKIASEKVWSDPLRWDRAAAESGERRRVFCASMADVFEDRRDLDAPRARLFELVEETPNLDWLLLTKRPENMVPFAPESWRDEFPANVWAGCTVESQKFTSRIDALLEVPARVRFLSCEPLLERLELAPWLDPDECGHETAGPRAGSRRSVRG